MIVFVHIPKCSGTYVRSKLEMFDETDGKYGPRWQRHSELGMIDTGHIPLFVLRKYFNEDYMKVKNYTAYAVVRDPVARFPSSFFEHVRKIDNVAVPDLTKNELSSRLNSVIGFLQKKTTAQSYLGYEYIHFQRQVDFVNDLGERLVENLYDISNVELMLRDIGARAGISLSESRNITNRERNQREFFRNGLTKILYRSAKFTLSPFLSTFLRGYLSRVSYSTVFVRQDRKLRDFFGSEYVRDFVREYYRLDFTLVADVAKL